MKARMEMKKWLTVVAGVVLVGLVAGCAPAALPAPAPAPAPVTKEIVIGSIADYSGPYKTHGRVFMDAFSTFERYVNEELGDIKGLKVRVVHYDFRGQTPLAVSQMKRGNLEDKPMAWVSGYSSATSACKKQALTDKTLIMALANFSGATEPESFVFALRPYYEESVVTFLTKYCLPNWKEPRKLKWGILGLEAMPSVKWLGEHGDQIAEATGTEFVLSGWLPPVLPDVAPFITKMEASMPDYVWIVHAEPVVTAFLTAIEQKGLQEKGVTPFVGEYAEPVTLRAIAGKEAVNGLLEVTPFSSYVETNIPLMAKINELTEKYAPGTFPPGPIAIQTWLAALTIVKGTALAAEEVGWDKVASSDLRDLLASGAQIDTGGLSTPLYWKPYKGSYQLAGKGLHSCKVIRITAESEEILTDWIPYVNRYEIDEMLAK